MAITITGTDQKQAWVDKVLPPIEQVRPRVWSIPITFDDNPVRYTLCYLLAGDHGQCVVIDPGWDSDDGWRQLLDGLNRAGLTLQSVVGIVVTHLHIDHLGMVHRLAEATGAWVGMHPRESHALDEFTGESSADDRAWLLRCGVPADRLDSLLVTSAQLDYLARLARPTLLLEHGDTVPLPGRNVKVCATPGHTAGHICIIDVDSELIFTGDHVLPRITPNVGLGPNAGTRNALAEYYQSLQLMPQWDGFEVCPAHEYRFTGLAGRAGDLKTHHEERAQEILNVLTATPELTLWEIAKRLTWSRGWASLDGTNLRSALAETLAHVEYLAAQGQLFWGAPDPQFDASWVATVTHTNSPYADEPS